jgi:hypothetical protein
MNRGKSLAFCFVALSMAKPVPTFAESALVSSLVALSMAKPVPTFAESAPASRPRRNLCGSGTRRNSNTPQIVQAPKVQQFQFIKHVFGWKFR